MRHQASRQIGSAFKFAPAAWIVVPGFAKTGSVYEGPETAVVENVPAPNTMPTEALVAANHMRVLIKKQAGYVSEELLHSLNASNTPRFVHVSHGISMNDWAALLRSPAFTDLGAHGNQHYKISASAFLPGDEGQVDAMPGANFGAASRCQSMRMARLEDCMDSPIDAHCYIRFIIFRKGYRWLNQHALLKRSSTARVMALPWKFAKVRWRCPSQSLTQP